MKSSELTEATYLVSSRSEIQLYVLLVLSQVATLDLSAEHSGCVAPMHGHAKVLECSSSVVLSVVHHPVARWQCRALRPIGICHQ